MFMKREAGVQRGSQTPAFVITTNIYANVLFSKLSLSAQKKDIFEKEWTVLYISILEKKQTHTFRI